MADYNHQRFLNWANRTPQDDTKSLFSMDAALAIAENDLKAPSPTLNPNPTIELLVRAGHLIDEGGGYYRRSTT